MSSFDEGRKAFEDRATRNLARQKEMEHRAEAVVAAINSKTGGRLSARKKEVQRLADYQIEIEVFLPKKSNPLMEVAVREAEFFITVIGFDRGLVSGGRVAEVSIDGMLNTLGDFYQRYSGRC